MGYYDDLLAQVRLPKMIRVKRRLISRKLDDVSGTVKNAIEAFPEIGLVNGKRVALAVGSRGINHLPEIVRTTVHCLKGYGAQVYIVPAMGSHGGARAESQELLLNHLGVTPDAVGAPIFSSMETVVIAHTEDGVPIHFDKEASKADYTVSIARVKPHSSFRGAYESGMVKMNVIGLGKQKGADSCHAQGTPNFAKNLEKLGRFSIGKSNLLFSLALLEDSRGDIAKILAVPAEEIMDVELPLLEEAKSYLPSIPFKDLDVLLIDEFGKNIIGTGMDSNVIQRFTSEHMIPDPVTKRVVVLRLTQKSDGNASGCGLADISTRKMFNEMSFEKTYPNSLTARTVRSCLLPMIMESDFDAIRAGVKNAPEVDHDNIRIVRIHNTSLLEDFEISEPMLPEALHHPEITVCSEPFEWVFDADGNLPL